MNELILHTEDDSYELFVGEGGTVLFIVGELDNDSYAQVCDLNIDYVEVGGIKIPLELEWDNIDLLVSIVPFLDQPCEVKWL